MNLQYGGAAYTTSSQIPRHHRASSATGDGGGTTDQLTPHHVGHGKGLSVHDDSGKGWSGKPHRSGLPWAAY